MLRIVTHGRPDYKSVLDLRNRVLRAPLGLTLTPNQLAAEKDELILADFRKGSAIACLQFQRHGAEWKMRQVAVSSEMQGQGIGSRLVRFSEDWALREGARSFVLNARDTAVPFYERLGYRIQGERFEEVGIPHFKMAKDLTRPSGYLKYSEAFPSDLAGAKPLAILPWGALEWHGNHLPAGLDGIVAEEFAKRLAARVGGVLFPTTYLPITTLPHPTSLDVSTTTLRAVLDDLTRGILKSGFRAALLVSGHYAQGHEWELYEAAERAHAAGLPMLAAAPLEVLGEDDLLDHAGKWEAACLEMFRPDLVRLSEVPERELIPTEDGVLGESPLESDPIAGWETMDRAWSRWAQLADPLLAGEWDTIQRFYDQRKAAYQPYRDRYYRTSWEQAISDWWRDQPES